MLTENELRDAIVFGREQRQIEFKSPVLRTPGCDTAVTSHTEAREERLPCFSAD